MMTVTVKLDSESLAEPLQDFASLAEALRSELHQIDRLHEDYKNRQQQGKILPNLVEALRIELTYNSNAIEGSTARLLMGYQLLRHEFPHIIISVSERAEYLAALDEANTGRIERFASFVLHSIEQSLRRYLN